MNAAQTKFLLGRIETATRKYRYAQNAVNNPKPPEIIAAEERIDAWESQCARDRENLDTTTEKARIKAVEAVHFLPENDALAEVRRYEALVEERQ